MNKQETVNAISELPLFELKEVAVNQNEWILQPNDKAVVVVNQSKSIAYVTGRYKLVQFKEVLTPVVESIEDFKSRLNYHNGVCVMDLFPNSTEFEDSGTKYGLTVINSVNKSTSIMVKFNVLVNNKVLCFPKKIAGFKKKHTGKVFKLTQDYIDIISKVKESWKNIVLHFPEHHLTNDNVTDVCTNFHIKQSDAEDVKNKVLVGYDYTLWDIVELKIEEISERNYTSEIHRSNALNRLCEDIYKYAMVLGI